MRTALLAGGSGLVGAALLQQLLDGVEYDRVISLGRRTLELSHPRLVQVTVDFGALDEVIEDLSCEDAFCCLGTTMKQAGSQDDFRAIDHVAVLAFAWTARRHGARRFFTVSALGADARARVFYLRVKGETEEALKVLGFQTLGIFQPSLLLGLRQQPRRAERIAAVALWLAEPMLLGGLARYRAVHAEVVARAMLRCSYGRRGQGVLVFRSDEIHDLGRADG
jgi:uncharacterized protein YbjT (DUF2867 family)